MVIRGYSIVFMMVWFKQYQASCLAMCLERIASAHLTTLERRNCELSILVSIGLDHGAQEFPGFSDFQMGDGGGDSVRATGQSEVPRGVRLSTIAPFSTFPFEVNQAPITFVVGQGSTSGTEGSCPIIQHGLHLSKDIGARGVVGGSSMEELGVIDEVQADQFDCFVGQGVPHLKSKTSRLHHFDDD